MSLRVAGLVVRVIRRVYVAEQTVKTENKKGGEEEITCRNV